MIGVQNAYAQTSTSQPVSGAAAPAAQPPAWMNFVPMLAIFLIFYVLFIRPQGKQMKEHRKMLEALKKGDRVLTEGGLYGTIVGFKGTDLELKIAEGVKVHITRQSVRKNANPEAELVSVNGQKNS
ncbi:MAG: preprotein translocase subunit YajC [Elusimicrobia bacterium CG1_02_63_36]|nr:MAG: preprotein translocase subunit YajC [Elusimicrobia bacterium CG1_02_63_36]PIP81964.1 MAG: preprotein translocase subunit YajC [Elusimicrobia bacterium CG22_combo_CG10-13_8_21_14_all_63_91]PJA18477.1 MAG: preprotein translocase subunit YajC [Elusimicrobia bacterium CG_4_10_14_0_2_um_filter_63_34]PJB24500.1 MAG: preprotein translocase subunit YajC [Elusimicrobia bacterium CG_4_9_14_3_um_filter_62_55]